MDPQKEKRLLNEYQRGFPLVSNPFAQIAKEVELAEAEVLSFFQAELKGGRISRLGPVVAPLKVGPSTLAALAVPSEQLEEVAALVNSYPEVNHNYCREDQLNLWFVLHAQDEDHLQAVLMDIQQRTGLAVHDFRLEEEFRIDLAFELFPEAVP